MNITVEELNALLDAAYERGKSEGYTVTYPPMMPPHYPGDTHITLTGTGANSK